MSLILHTGFDDSIKEIKERFLNDEFRKLDAKLISKGQFPQADLFLIGPRAKEPIRIVQTVSKEDSLISTVILPDEENFQHIKQSLLFSPFVGKAAMCLPFNERTYIELENALQQTRQRRKFSTITTRFPDQKRRSAHEVKLEHLGNFLDQAPIGAVLLNNEEEIVGLNVFARQLFRLQPFQSVEALTDLFSVDAVQHIRTQLADSNLKSIEVNSVGAFYEITFAEIKSESGEDLDILLITDITEQKLENERIRDVLDSLPQMAWSTNSAGELTYLTEGWFRFTGQSFAKAMGNGWKEALHPDDRAEFVANWEKSVAEGKPFEAEARYRRHDNVYRYHLVRGISIKGNLGKIMYWLGTCTDIDDQKTTENQLSAMVEQRTRELMEVNALLKRSNHDLEEFAYVASHDLKEPLRKIRMYIDRAASSKTNQAKEGYLEKVDQAATRMLDLIQGIMAYSQLSGNKKFEDVELNALLGEILEDIDNAIKEKGARVVVGELGHVRGIRVQIAQLISNLILNSLKYSKAVPLVEISSEIVEGSDMNFGQADKKGRYLALKVKDNGIGFEKKYADEIFVMFKRLHGRQEYSGAGIGLALVKKIVENHRGFIEVEGEPDKGATFRIFFPVV